MRLGLDIMGLDIFELDILGLEILGLDILETPRVHVHCMNFTVAPYSSQGFHEYMIRYSMK